MSAPGTKRVDGEISKYLNRNAVAVDLPDKRNDAPSTYPALIIDGASGTGKTQQAFALVKKYKTIIYFLVSDPPKGGFVIEQQIYRSMRELTMDEHERRFAHRIDVAIKLLNEDENNKDEDICSVDFLRDAINLSGNIAIDYDPIRGLWARKADSGEQWVRKADSRVNWKNPLVDVVLWMCSKHLQWDKVGALRVVPIQLEGTPDVSFEDLYCQLENVILFSDEAGFQGGDDRLDPGAIDRLRFVRTLGRALNMRVVLAGTAATAANLIADPKPPKTSVGGATRSGGIGDLAWMECLFLWKTMSEEDVKSVVMPELASSNDLQPPPNDWELALISVLECSRPYLVHLFGRVLNGRHINSSNLLEMLEEVGETLASEKGMSDESNLMYYMGAWLHQRHTSPCTYLAKPAELVRGHYFEPCVVLDLEGKPACGLRWRDCPRTSGHLRVKIYRYDYRHENRTMWCASMKDTNSEPRAGFCWDFAGIQYSLLSGCVQQCLAREPLLAVALSTQCGMMDKAKFHQALSMLYQETSQQRHVGSVDGELSDILSALLQLASNCEKLFGKRMKLGTFLKTIVDYLTNDSDASFALCLEAFCLALKEYGEPKPSELRESIIEDTINNKFEIVDRTGKCDDFTMPWLVPACSFRDLNETMARASSLFDGSDIAGLVPGVRNAAFNAEAYTWKTLSKETPSETLSKKTPSKAKDKVALPEWVFEFRARTSTYSTEEALKDLQKKCSLRQKEKLLSETESKKGRWASLISRAKEYSLRRGGRRVATDQPEELECHAILIAVTGGRNLLRDCLC